MTSLLTGHNVNLSSSLVSWLNLPKRMVNRMQLGFYGHDSLFSEGINRSVAEDNLPVDHQFSKQLEPLTAFPSSFSFVTSSYALGLFITALLLNRIQHLVIPRPRPPHSPFRRYPHRPTLRQVWSLFFPANLSSTTFRLCFRLPSAYLLLRSLTIISVLLLQSLDLLPSWDWMQSLGAWVDTKHMADICWWTFCAVCIALAVGQLTNGLEGVANGSSSINLFSYTFLLHMYSFPFYHPESTESQERLSRPDVHGLVILFLPLLQLTIIHLLGIRQSWARQRLIPTTFCGLLGLAHFHYAVFLSPLPYPYANYLTSIVESVLLLITTITVILNAFTQILLEGTVTRPLVGLGTMADSNLFGVHPSSMPSLEDDFSVAVLRLGTASFEATGVAGLQNEVVSVHRPIITLEKAGLDSSQLVLKRVGFANEIAAVQAATPIQETGFPSERWAAGKQYLVTLWRLLRKLGPHIFMIFRQAYSNWRHGVKPQQIVPVKPSETESPDAYQVFLKGGNVSDDEDDPFLPGADDQSSKLSSEDEGEEEEEEEEEEEDSQDHQTLEFMKLYTDLKDLSTAVEHARPSTPVLVAHLVASGRSPLTRRRYNAMQRASPSPADSNSRDDWLQFVLERRREALAMQTEPAADISYTCVICTVMPRDIICWPCRCLALCNDCRANLASRSPAHKHSCPCCRHRVQGYSRIFLP